MNKPLEVVDRDSLPQRGRGRPLSSRIAEILDALKKLGSNEALKYQCDNQKDALYLKANLIYHFNKRHRPGLPTMPNLMSAKRGTVLFIWVDGNA